MQIKVEKIQPQKIKVEKAQWQVFIMLDEDFINLYLSSNSYGVAQSLKW